MATHKSTLSSALLFLAFGLGRAAGTLIPEPTVVSNATPPITVFGDNGSLNGIFDPSAMIFGNSVYMTYSAVPAANAIRTRLAVLAGAANASQWTFLTELNAPFSASLPGTSCPGGVCVGTVVHEVSSLVVEDEDPDPLRRVKVLTHTYLVGSSGQLHYDIGRITLWTAPNLSTPGPWPGEPMLGWTSQSPFSDVGFNLSALPALSDCILFTEPGLLVVPPGTRGLEAVGAVGNSSVLLLALGCAYLDAQLGVGVTRIEAIASPDHGTTWVYVGVLLTPADMELLGFPAAGGVDAADLVIGRSTESNASSIFLSATPGESWGYDGCLIFELGGLFSSAQKGLVEYITTGAAQFSGACTAAPPLLPWMLPLLFPQDEVAFRIIQSHIPVAGPSL